MQKWTVRAGDKIGNYPCVRLGSELALSGLMGDIWQVGPNTYRAVVHRNSKGELLPNERIYTFQAPDLRRWVNRLSIKSSQMQQVVFANNFSRPFCFTEGIWVPSAD